MRGNTEKVLNKLEEAESITEFLEENKDQFVALLTIREWNAPRKLCQFES